MNRSFYAAGIGWPYPSLSGSRSRLASEIAAFMPLECASKPDRMDRCVDLLRIW